MEKKIYSYSFIIFLFFAISSQGQNIVERYVFNTAGAKNIIGTIELESSAGEPVVGLSQFSSIGFLNVDTTFATGIDDLPHNTDIVSVFPNPATDKLQLNSSTIIDKVIVMNHLGQVVIFKQINNTNNELDLAGIAPGIYFLMLYKENGSLMNTVKFVKLND
jgi:hypothetical protein